MVHTMNTPLPHKVNPSFKIYSSFANASKSHSLCKTFSTLVSPRVYIKTTLNEASSLFPFCITTIFSQPCLSLRYFDKNFKNFTSTTNNIQPRYLQSTLVSPHFAAPSAQIFHMWRWDVAINPVDFVAPLFAHGIKRLIFSIYLLFLVFQSPKPSYPTKKF